MWDKWRAKIRKTYLIIKKAAKEYGFDRVNRMAAAVSYRAIFAMAPLLILAVYIVGLVVGSNELAQTEILNAIDRITGPTVQDAVEVILTELADTGTVTGVVGLVLLLWTSSSLFLELQNDLNDIFDVPYEQTSGILGTALKRGLGFIWALSLGLIVVFVLLLNNIWQFLRGLFPESFGPVHSLISVLTPLVSVVVLPLVIALIFRTLTQAKVRWRAILWGSLFTSVAILAASYGAAIYFRVSSSSAAGIAGAIFVIVLLVYIFSSVFLFGAEVTKVFDDYLDTGSLPGAPVSAEQEAVG